MPGNRKAKYFRKCIVEYIALGRASCPGIGASVFISSAF
jgi:hypothetical protein